MKRTKVKQKNQLKVKPREAEAEVGIIFWICFYIGVKWRVVSLIPDVGVQLANKSWPDNNSSSLYLQKGLIDCTYIKFVVVIYFLSLLGKAASLDVD